MGTLEVTIDVDAFNVELDELLVHRWTVVPFGPDVREDQRVIPPPTCEVQLVWAPTYTMVVDGLLVLCDAQVVHRVPYRRLYARLGDTLHVELKLVRE